MYSSDIGLFVAFNLIFVIVAIGYWELFPKIVSFLRIFKPVVAANYFFKQFARMAKSIIIKFNKFLFQTTPATRKDLGNMKDLSQ